MTARAPRPRLDATAVAALDLVQGALRRRGRSPRTQDAVLGAARQLLAALGRGPADVRHDDVLAYLARRRDVVSPVSLQAERSRLRAFFRALLAAGAIDHDPTDHLPTLRARPNAALVLSEGTVERMLGATTPDPSASPRRRALRLRDRAALELLYGAGLRRSELLRVTTGDLDLVLGSLAVRPAKRGPPRVVPLPVRSLPHLVAYAREARPALVRPGVDTRDAFLLGQRGRALDSLGAYRLVRRAGARVRTRATPHALRRSVATHAAKHGLDVAFVADLLGHTSLRSTERYVALDPDDLRAAVERLPACPPVPGMRYRGPRDGELDEDHGGHGEGAATPSPPPG